MNRGEAPGSRDGRSESAESASVALPDLSKGGAGFDFSSILAVADMLPVMIAFMDADKRLRFVNKPLAYSNDANGFWIASVGPDELPVGPAKEQGLQVGDEVAFKYTGPPVGVQ